MKCFSSTLRPRWIMPVRYCSCVRHSPSSTLGDTRELDGCGRSPRLGRLSRIFTPIVLPSAACREREHDIQPLSAYGALVVEVSATHARKLLDGYKYLPPTWPLFVAVRNWASVFNSPLSPQVLHSSVRARFRTESPASITVTSNMVHFWERAWAPPLTPVCLTPHRSSSAVEPISVLEKIDHVEITNFAEIGGVVYYFVDVYLKHHTNRIPTNQRLETSRRDQPDYTIQKRFNDFANLRYQVWSYAQRRHDGGAACKYCSKSMDFLVTRFSQPRLFIKLFVKSKKARSRLLAKGINKYIELAIGGKEEPRQRYYTCDGYMMIPALVERFLRDDA